MEVQYVTPAVTLLRMMVPKTLVLWNQMNKTEEMKMQHFLVQKHIEGEVCAKIYTETELISYLNMSDCSDEEYRIYDISTFGEVKEVFYKGWQPNCLIEVIDSDGNIIVRGYGTEH